MKGKVSLRGDRMGSIDDNGWELVWLGTFVYVEEMDEGFLVEGAFDEWDSFFVFLESLDPATLEWTKQRNPDIPERIWEGFARFSDF